MARLTSDKIQEIKKLIIRGYSSREISNTTGLSHNTINNLRKQQYPRIKTSKGGRPKKIPEIIEKKMIMLYESGELCDSSEGKRYVKKQGNIECCNQTIRNCLDDNEFRCYSKKSKPLLSTTHISKRFSFAKDHEHWTQDVWSKVIWSDECSIELFSSRKEIFYKRSGTGPKKNHHKPKVQAGGGKLMMWGCMTADGGGSLIFIEGTITGAKYVDILKDGLTSSIRDWGLEPSDVIFMQDNAPAHASRIVQDYLRDQQITVMQWPPNSPDLNPIENIWKVLKERVGKRLPKPKNKAELKVAVKEEWKGIEPDIFANTAMSMPKRIRELLESKGGSTSY